MANAQVTFNTCIQDSQDYGSDDEHMVSRLFFTMRFQDIVKDGVTDIKQVVGSEFETTPLEVTPPQGFNMLNYEEFRKSAETYYRSCIGGQGSVIRIENCANVRMRNNVIAISMSFFVSLNNHEMAGW